MAQTRGAPNVAHYRFVCLERGPAPPGDPCPGLQPGYEPALRQRPGRPAAGLQGRCLRELDWSPGIHDQCEGRYHRDGQTEPSVSYFLVSDVGSDPVVADVLNLKEQGSRPIVGPDRPLFQAADVSDRMRKLAESVLKKRRRAAA